MRFAQESGGIQINFPTVDWTQLVPTLVGLFFDAIGKALNDSSTARSTGCGTRAPTWSARPTWR
jgi:hypothetical protein